MKANGFYRSDDIDVDFSCTMEKNDFGVSGSPEWTEPVPGSEEVISLAILGVDVEITSLPKALQDAIYELADDVDWEFEE